MKLRHHTNKPTSGPLSISDILLIREGVQ